jgi:hypothetical protein
MAVSVSGTMKAPKMRESAWLSQAVLLTILREP